jgi:hypothetical protein
VVVVAFEFTNAKEKSRERCLRSAASSARPFSRRTVIARPPRQGQLPRIAREKQDAFIPLSSFPLTSSRTIITRENAPMIQTPV